MTISKESFTPCDLVIYGGLGDLSRRKLIISLYRLEHGQFLEPDTRIIAVDRLAENSESFIKIAYQSSIPSPVLICAKNTKFQSM